MDRHTKHVLKRTCALLLVLIMSGCSHYSSICRDSNRLAAKIICSYKRELKHRRNREEMWFNPPTSIKTALSGTLYDTVFKARSVALVPKLGKNSPQTTNLMMDLLDEVDSYNSIQMAYKMGWKGRDINDGSRLSYYSSAYEPYGSSEVLLCYFIRCAVECDERNNYNLKRNGRTTPLMMAALMGNVSLIQYLVEHGAKLDEVGGAEYGWGGEKQLGRTALHFAALADNREAYDYLLQLGANPNIRDSTGKRACDYLED